MKRLLASSLGLAAIVWLTLGTNTGRRIWSGSEEPTTAPGPQVAIPSPSELDPSKPELDRQEPRALASADPEATRLMVQIEALFRRTRRGIRLVIDTERETQNVGQPDSVEIWGILDGNVSDTAMLFVFSQPRWLRGTGLYLEDLWNDREDAMWYHMRSFNRFKRLPRSSLKLLVAGTCLTYEDARGFLSTDKYTFRPAARPNGSSDSEMLLIATPKDEALAVDLGVGYLTLTLDTDKNMVREIHYFDTAGQLVKSLETRGAVQIGELWLPDTAEMKDLENQRFSTLRYTYWPLPQAPPESLFATEIGEESLLDRFFGYLELSGISEIEGSDLEPPVLKPAPPTHSRR